jgi:cytochrome c
LNLRTHSSPASDVHSAREFHLDGRSAVDGAPSNTARTPSVEPAAAAAGSHSAPRAGVDICQLLRPALRQYGCIAPISIPSLNRSRSMKVTPLLAAAAALFAFSLPASAAPDAEAATKLLKDNGCTKCHSVDKAKKGPAYQKVAAKYKGKADAEAKLTDMVTKSPKVKFEDGTEEEHKAVSTKDAAQVKNLVQWILAQ